MFISVLISSRNRADSLRRTLESLLCTNQVESFDWELVVVDNDSEDQTRKVCQEFRERFPKHFRFLVERKRGVSNARNLAISAAKGDVLAFTDDDVRCAPDYLGAIRQIFGEYSADGVQGRVLPDFHGSRPIWMDEGFHPTLALRDCGDRVTELVGPLFGCNMIVRPEVFKRIGGFLPELGPGAAGLAEDTELSSRMRRAGYRLMYAPQIVVWHQVPKERLTRSYFRNWSYIDGRSWAHFTPLGVSLTRYGLYVLKEWMLKESAAIWQRCFGHPAQALRYQCDVRWAAGFFWQQLLFRCGMSYRIPTIRNRLE